jgi:hypothetical protein
MIKAGKKYGVKLSAYHDKDYGWVQVTSIESPKKKKRW